MMVIGVWILLAIVGLCIGFLGGYAFGGPYGMMIGFFAGLMMLMPIMQMIGMAKQKGFLMLYRTLKDDEKFVHFPDKFGKLKTIVMNIKSPEVLYRKKLGRIDDKGTEFAWGTSPASFGMPHMGMTVDIQAAQYTTLLGKDKDGIKDYDTGVKKFLGSLQYRIFKKKYRDTSKPEIDDINNELQEQIDTVTPGDPLEKKVFGETYGWKDFCHFLKYAYNPMAMENAIDTEKIWVKREQMGYKDVDKNISRAKAIMMVLFGIMIFIAVLSAIDIGSIGKMFGL